MPRVWACAQVTHNPSKNLRDFAANPCPDGSSEGTICQQTDILSGTFPSRAQGFLKARGRFLGLMYATSSSTDVYHLLASDESHTLCGLRVAPMESCGAILVRRRAHHERAGGSAAPGRSNLRCVCFAWLDNGLAVRNSAIQRDGQLSFCHWTAALSSSSIFARWAIALFTTSSIWPSVKGFTI